jgi:DNA-binding transcriptional LysR family regulator
LFDRLSSGYVLTPTGEKLVGIARGIETSVFDIEETLSVGNPEISGVVRLAISDSMLLQLMPTLASFSDKHPSITLQCIGGNEFLDLERREADVAIRASLSEPSGLAAQYIAQVSASAYASRRYLKTHPAKLPVSEHIWVAWDDQSRSRETEKWYESSVPRGARIACRFDSGAAILSAVRAGMGVGFMWRFLGDEDPELVRLQLLDLQMSTGLWLLTTDSLERSPSIVAFLDHVAADVEAMRGRVPGFD